MTSFPILPQLPEFCDAGVLRPLPYAVKIIWYPQYLKMVVAASQKRALALLAQGQSVPAYMDLNYRMRMRGKMHPYEYVMSEGQGAKQELLLADAYLEVGRRYEQTRLQQARLFCFAVAARYCRSDELNIQVMEARIRRAYYEMLPEGGSPVQYEEDGVLSAYMWQLFMRAYEGKQDFLDRMYRHYGFGNSGSPTPQIG